MFQEGGTPECDDIHAWSPAANHRLLGDQESRSAHDLDLSLSTGALRNPLPQSCRKVAIQSHTQRAKLAELSRQKDCKKGIERACNEFVDCLHSAITEDDFRRVAERTAHSLGFRWFAYFSRRANGPNLISSYPKSWTSHYFDEGYEDIDPVLQKSRIPSGTFLWDGRDARSAKSPKERRLFDDALSFKIRTGLTVRIPTSQNQFAAFTLAVDDRSLGLDRFIETSQDILQMVGLTYHAHVSARIGRTPPNG
jgi:LuxR family transcriptional activator of conjugal transfer of Ti plasmids